MDFHGFYGFKKDLSSFGTYNSPGLAQVVPDHGHCCVLGANSRLHTDYLLGGNELPKLINQLIRRAFAQGVSDHEIWTTIEI